MSKAKNGKAVDVKKAAAGDRQEPNGSGKAEKIKAVKIQTLTPANTKLVKRGFVKMFADFVVKRGSVTTDDLAAEFAGRQVEGQEDHQAARAPVCTLVREQGRPQSQVEDDGRLQNAS